MELASRILSILLGAAVMVLLLWPVTVPLGFSGAWWASRQAQAPAETAPAPPVSIPIAADKTASVAPTQPPAPAPAQKVVPGDRTRTAAIEREPDTPKAVTPQAETKTYRRVMVRDGGTLQADGVVIRLAGISAREAGATCKDARGTAWRCGAAAKAALSKLIRGRAITCALPKGGEHNIIVARCSVGGIDLSTWTLRQGWAEPKDANEAPLAEAVAAAKKERLGLWRDGG
ncbi:MAG TPA: thermonuclease family protein [Methyloceanibacter sp.]|nr:thermonuclease family protein [Methyloceanibacter sp.]